MLEWKELCDQLFPQGHTVTASGQVLTGQGRVGDVMVAVVGTLDHAAIGVDIALQLSEAVIAIMNDQPRMPILMLVDTQGQQLSRRDELLGNSPFLAHLAKCFAVARTRGHQLLSVVYSEAVSGGFLSLGMIADETYAVPGAQIRVMALPAMSRITKLPLEELEALCRTSPILGPGAHNFVALGAVEEIWEGPLDQCLLNALSSKNRLDQRRALGASRGGRTGAARVAQLVREY
ncbi:biotin-independent malonate decarboxylase subunit gamma [Herminiimonas contaminans]|uniref:Biotin-independent malonate decarboxylase subunit gamma n=1 Tax=Herminiimonas contaminans TaxID=1111140 RepID=A0ABS0ETC2_9BURK|nr:biotin-independent malonate decarboxylase subunit gamma [Herminiimonas contaminans]MBF8178103.1 biotin-independent malonate decarboxylase subunit gamma [Herminiimonas contaminans]